MNNMPTIVKKDPNVKITIYLELYEFPLLCSITASIVRAKFGINEESAVYCNDDILVCSVATLEIALCRDIKKHISMANNIGIQGLNVPIVVVTSAF